MVDTVTGFIPETVNWLGGGGRLGTKSEVVAAFFAVTTVVVAIAAAILATVHVRWTRRIQRESTAIESYDGYLKLCLQEPEYASGQWELKNSGLSRALNREKYEWFVAIMLGVCEQILSTNPGDRAWRETIEFQLSYHVKYLRSRRGRRYFKCYSRELVQLIKTVI